MGIFAKIVCPECGHEYGTTIGCGRATASYRCAGCMGHRLIRRALLPYPRGPMHGPDGSGLPPGAAPPTEDEVEQSRAAFAGKCGCSGQFLPERVVPLRCTSCASRDVTTVRYGFFD